MFFLANLTKREKEENGSRLKKQGLKGNKNLRPPD